MPSVLTLQSLPLFPLGTVLFPGGVLPLRIFEVRYLDMIGRCHKAGAPFGVVSADAGQRSAAARAHGSLRRRRHAGHHHRIRHARDPG